MDLHDWLDKADNAGKAAWLALQLDRSKAAVSLWRTDGVPLHLIPKIAALTDGEVTEDEMLRHSLARKIDAGRHRTASDAAKTGLDVDA